MVVSISFSHVLNSPPETVFNTCFKRDKLRLGGFWTPQKGPSDIKEVKELDIVNDPDFICRKRRLTLSNILPIFFRKLAALKTETVQIDEEYWSERRNKRYWIRSRNITWEDQATIAHSAFLSPLAHDQEKTCWEHESFIDCERFGMFGKILELYLKRVVLKAINEDIKELEKLCNN